MVQNEICFMPATELAERLRSRRLSASEVVQAFLERIRRVNPSLNAYVTLDEERALREARAADERLFHAARPEPLHGVPFSVKDVVFTAGLRTTAGSRIYERYVPEKDAIAVARLRAAGAILLGKTNTPEFGYKATTENPLFGPTCNPWDMTRTAGGSSGGAAAATAAGLSPLSVGTDGGGSIRIPASFCGVFGVMAGPHEIDRVSLPESPTSCLSELEHPRKNLRLGYSADLGFATVEHEVAAVVEAVLPVFEEIGHSVEKTEIALGAAKKSFETIVLVENAGANGKYLEEHRALMDEGLVKFIEAGLGYRAVDYTAATRVRDDVAAKLAAFFADHDLLLTPTVAVAPFPIGQAPREMGGVKMEPVDWIPFTYAFNLTGNPAASVPCGTTAVGLPVGLQVVGPRHADALVLNLCAQLEEARPWAHHRPALAAQPQPSAPPGTPVPGSPVAGRPSPPLSPRAAATRHLGPPAASGRPWSGTPPSLPSPPA